jgi:hypothetical protein
MGAENRCNKNTFHDHAKVKLYGADLEDDYFCNCIL